MNDANHLLSWYKRHGRHLPWRNTRDPYRILVSEIMLQQTQVSRVLDFYRAWLKQFPNWKALAEAKNAEVICAWSGLGYNRRARMLRDIARTIITTNTRPKTAAEWLPLKGIGPYTANAIACFAFHEMVFPIDTNTRRVAGRLLLGRAFPTMKDDERIQKKASTWQKQSAQFYDIPQAMFDLANAACTKVPDCKTCPMRSTCKAAPKFLKGHVRIPKRTTPAPKERLYEGKRYPDRIYRGRIVKILHEQPKGISIKQVGTFIDKTFNKNLDIVWLKNMLQRLKKDDLISVEKDSIFLSKR